MISPWEDLIDGGVGIAVGDPGKDVSEVGERIDLVELAGFDQGRDDGPVLGTAI